MNPDHVKMLLERAKGYEDIYLDLRRADLREADLSGANLSRADLSGANLRRADLREANLREANLSRADLSGADLRWANLSRADLSGANLRWASLSGADLRWANLSRADLSGANLSEALGDQFVVFQAGRHQAIFAGGEGFIGCERHSYAEWLERGTKIGAANGYSGDEIARYMAFIRLAVEYLQGVEARR
jgi:uncharacterized protein YjbI with pentapeptide repeats